MLRMKLYDAMAPHPRVVRMFCDEKGLDLPTVVLSLGIGDTFGAAHLARNPLGQVPVLELADGRCIAETVAICEYLEELEPSPALIGGTPLERAEARMWTERVQLNICAPMFLGYRMQAAAVPRYGARVPVALPFDPSGQVKDVAARHLEWLDHQLDAGPYLCGERFTLADIFLYCFLDYGIQTGQLLDRSWSRVAAWYDRVDRRPSVARTAAPQADFAAISGTI
jgi:glutathione S-transferase